MARRPALVVAAALAAAGLVLALVLARQHANAHAGITSFCAINEYVNCDRVATSPFSVVLGIPVAVWGMLGYGVELVLALAGLRSAGRRPGAEGWPSGLLLLVSAAAVLAAVALALVSELVIGALCLLCAGSWLISVGLFAAAWRASGPPGPAAAVRRDVALLRARPLASAAVAIAAIAAVALISAAYPRYWERPRTAAAPTPPAGASAHGPMVIVEFSDYACPFCATAHEETKAILAARPDVTLVHRQFPLDADCNPAVKRSIHPGACALARAGICAEAQGKLPAMDDALFRNQQAKRPVEELARSVGLDLAEFRRCLASPATEARLRSDIEAAVRVRLRATPTYVVGGHPYVGKLPVELLPPPRAEASRPPQ